VSLYCPNLRILLVSGYEEGTVESLYPGLLVGVEFLQKPFALKVMANRAHSIVKAQETARSFLLQIEGVGGALLASTLTDKRGGSRNLLDRGARSYGHSSFDTCAMDRSRICRASSRSPRSFRTMSHTSCQDALALARTSSRIGFPAASNSRSHQGGVLWSEYAITQTVTTASRNPCDSHGKNCLVTTSVQGLRK